MDSPQIVPTIKMIAEASGFSKSAVSDALRNKPNIPLLTRSKIQAIANSMGYQPDPRISLAMGYIRARKPVEQRSTLGWLNSSMEKDEFEKKPWWKGYLDGATRRAESLGYSLDSLWMHDPDLPAKRLQKVLMARGIQGLLLPPPWKSGWGNLLQWNEFSTAIIGATEQKPCAHRAEVDYFANILTALAELEKLGYQRPGLWLSGFHDHESKGRYRGAFYHWQAHHSPEKRIPTPPFDYQWDQLFQSWVIKEKPDVVLCLDNTIISRLEATGLRVPDDVGVVHLNVRSDVEGWAGIDPHPEIVGAAAVDLVTAHLARGEQGLPTHPKKILIQGSWVAGRTLRKIRSALVSTKVSKGRLTHS